MAWTNPRTWGAEQLLSADLNPHVRDNLNYLKANIGLGASVELTIAAGVVTKTKGYHSVDTQGDAATDDLDTINGGSEGDVLILRAENTARDVVLKHNTGNLQLAAGADFTLDSTEDTIMLIYDSANWLELSRSTNEV